MLFRRLALQRLVGFIDSSRDQQTMQLWHITTAVVAGSEPPRQWLLLPIPGREVFGLGVIAGAMVVAVTRGWLWWRGPKRSKRAASAAHQVAQPASAPVSVAVRPLAEPTAPVAVAARPSLDDASSAMTEPDVVAAVRGLVTRLESLKVILASGRRELVDRYLSAAVAELASGAAPCGGCDLVLVGFSEPTTATGLTMRRDDVSAALDVLAARTVAARRRLAESRAGSVSGKITARSWGLTVLVSRIAPSSAELAMLVDLVNEPGRLAALLPALHADQLPAAASVLELSHGGDGDQQTGLVSTLLPGHRPAPGPDRRPTPDAGRAADPPRPVSLRIGVLGQLTINGQPGALLPAQTQLIVALALHGEAGLFGKQLCELLGSDADHPKPADSLRQLIARTRRQLGQTSDGSEWIEHLGHGKYALHKETRLDWHEFERLTDQAIAIGDAGQLTAALAMIRGQPFTGCYYWWLDIELIDTVAAKIVTAASTLAELALGSRDAAAAARAARIGLVADATSEQLWRQLMRAEHAAGNLAGVREAWSRCVDAVGEIAVDGEPEPATAAVYHQLLDHRAS
ncbi:MAG TPA: bacterial transcriptional activator domain-containing protein [Streptosporangiaceae bacterium]|nr:bacterial transcriptional activator domain-containing protein [Streptosporangiaceae bacterium]